MKEYFNAAREYKHTPMYGYVCTFLCTYIVYISKSKWLYKNLQYLHCMNLYELSILTRMKNL